MKLKKKVTNRDNGQGMQRANEIRRAVARISGGVLKRGVKLDDLLKSRITLAKIKSKGERNDDR